MIATMVIAVAALAGILGIMSALQVENALPNALALSALLLSLSVSMAIIGEVGTISAKALISVGVMTLVVAALAGILYLIRDLNPESSIGNAEALSMLLLSLSASCGILAAVGLAGTAGFAGIGVLAALIAAVGAIVVAIGALFEKVPALEGFLDKGIPILQKIGYALGSFLGNIVGGFTEGATSGLPGVGKNLSDFMKNAQPFIDGAKGIDSSVTTGITSLCKAILALTGTDLLNAIASFITGGASFVKMGEQLKPFGEALSDYAQSVKGIDAKDIQASVKAAKALVSLNDALPKSGGFLGALLGNSDLANLGTQLKPFGEALSDYSNSVAKDGQKSHSPSKLTIQAGKWLGEGLIIGMNAMESKTYGAGKSMGETAFDSIRSALSGMNDIIDSDMDTRSCKIREKRKSPC